MDSELQQYFRFLGYVLMATAGLFLLRIILSIILRKRLAAGLVPDVIDASRSDGSSRFIALIGHRAAVPRTLGTHRLRATLGLKLVFWGVTAAMVKVMIDMKAPVIGIEALILALVLYLSVHTSVYEITYDRDSITLPRWWFGRSTRQWRDLDAVTDRQGWYLAFHFRDGTVIQAHKYVVGYAELRETAQKAMREN